MGKKYYLILLTLIVFSCGQIKSDTDNKANVQKNIQQSIAVDTSRITIIRLDSTNNWMRVFENELPTDLSHADLIVIEKILIKYIDEYNVEKRNEYENIKNKNPDLNWNIEDFIIELETYNRQYFTVTNTNGEKEVWINCYCGTNNLSGKNKSIPILVNDGGNCYFNFKINLNNRGIYEFMVNGHA